MKFLNAVNLNYINKNNNSRRKIYFNRSKLTNSLENYIIYLIFLLSTIFCLFYG